MEVIFDANFTITSLFIVGVLKRLDIPEVVFFVYGLVEYGI